MSHKERTPPCSASSESVPTACSSPSPASPLAIGLVTHGPGLIVIGGVLIVWAAVTLATRRR
jgi:hypothetical protein